MSNIAQTKTNLLQTIHSLEDKRNSLASAIESLQAALRKIEELSLDDLPSRPASPVPRIIAVENFDDSSRRPGRGKPPTWKDGVDRRQAGNFFEKVFDPEMRHLDHLDQPASRDED